MPEKEEIFKSSLKHVGIYSFAGLYKFCYDWLTQETELNVQEDKYTEKLKGDKKDIEIESTGERKVTDYFKFQVKVKFEIIGLKEIEIASAGEKTKTNQGETKIIVKGILIRDYDGKFEKTGGLKFLRSIYEKWIIKPRIDQFEEKLFGDCDEFLAQAKAWLALEGKR